jgi:hypothetical protein
MFSLFRKLDKSLTNHAKQRVGQIGPSGVDFGCLLVDFGLILGQELLNMVPTASSKTDRFLSKKKDSEK